MLNGATVKMEILLFLQILVQHTTLSFSFYVNLIVYTFCLSYICFQLKIEVSGKIYFLMNARRISQCTSLVNSR